MHIVRMHFILSSHHTSLHIFDHIHYKKLLHGFPKMRGGGGASKAVWNFSENSSDLLQPSFPKCWNQNLTPLSLQQRYRFYICVAQSQSCDINHLVGTKSGRDVEVSQDFGFSFLSYFPCFLYFCPFFMYLAFIFLYLVFSFFYLLLAISHFVPVFLYFVLDFFCILSKNDQKNW